MTDQELNELVAGKLGWEKVKGPFGNPTLGTIHEYGWKFEGKLWQIIPDYSTDIKAAWEIVEKVEAISVIRMEGNYHVHAPWLDGHAVIADTAPRAICEAFLKLENMRVGTDQK